MTNQSIYRFQGANVENMLEFANKYSKDLRTVVLTHNYRSTQPILDISKTLINRNEERLVKQIEGLSKDLITSRKELTGLKNDPVLREYNSAKEELADITNQVYELLQQTKPGLGLLSFTRKTNMAKNSLRISALKISRCTASGVLM